MSTLLTSTWVAPSICFSTRYFFNDILNVPVDGILIFFIQGGGSALLDSHGKMLKMLRGMQHVLDPPVTVKFRTGVKDNHPTAHKLIPKLESVVSGLPGTEFTMCTNN